MGYQDRDYLRDSNEPPSYIKMPQLAPIFWIIIICVVLSIIEADQKLKMITDVSYDAIFNHGYIWSIVLAPFSPDFFWGTFGHCLALFYVGRRLVVTDGLIEFLSLYFFSAMVGLLLFWSCQRIPSNRDLYLFESIDVAIWSLGSIGMVYAVRYPTEKILLYFVIPIQIKLFMMGVVVVVLLMMASRPTDFVSYLSLLGSLGFGYLYAFKHFQLSSVFQKIKRLFGKVSLPIMGGGSNLKTMSEEEIKQEIDRLLDKITEKGAISLSAQERDFLMKSSKRHR